MLIIVVTGVMWYHWTLAKCQTRRLRLCKANTAYFYHKQSFTMGMMNLLGRLRSHSHPCHGDSPSSGHPLAPRWHPHWASRQLSQWSPALAPQTPLSPVPEWSHCSPVRGARRQPSVQRWSFSHPTTTSAHLCNTHAGSDYYISRFFKTWLHTT